MTVVSILTDFGEGDDEAMLLKGVIWGIASHAKIADISHAVPAQDVVFGARLLGESFLYFPAGSIHLAVVDPGVGTTRRGLAARLGMHYFVGPDNGLITGIYSKAKQHGWDILLVELTNPSYWLEEINPIFHGRDIFAPVAGHLANGIDIYAFGKPFVDPILLK